MGVVYKAKVSINKLCGEVKKKWYSFTPPSSSTPSPSVSNTPTPSMSVSRTPTPTPSISESHTPTPSPSQSISKSPTPSTSTSHTPRPSQTPMVTPSITISKPSKPKKKSFFEKLLEFLFSLFKK